jgi:tetratricopeptide (TPR) repeat protein
LRENNCTEAVAYLKIAVERNPENSDAKEQLAQCLVELEEHQQALNLYEELLAAEPDNPRIKKQIETLKKTIYVRNLPSEYQAIPRTDQITRSQFASYLMLHLEFLQSYRTSESKIIVDSIHHWAQSYIQQTVNLGLIDLFPNRTFQPNLPITRLELAKAASRVLEILQSTGSKSIPSGEVVVPDVSSGNVYYPIVAKSISAGVLSLDADGRFHGSRPVSGAEIISTVNRLKSLAESS